MILDFKSIALSHSRSELLYLIFICRIKIDVMHQESSWINRGRASAVARSRQHIDIDTAYPSDEDDGTSFSSSNRPPSLVHKLPDTFCVMLSHIHAVWKLLELSPDASSIFGLELSSCLILFGNPRYHDAWSSATRQVSWYLIFSSNPDITILDH